MNEEKNNEEVIKNCDERKEKNDSLLQIILTIILMLLIMWRTFLFIVCFILWLILRRTVNKDNVLWKAYNSAFKIIGTLALVVLIAFGTCTAVLIGGSIF